MLCTLSGLLELACTVATMHAQSYESIAMGGLGVRAMPGVGRFCGKGTSASGAAGIHSSSLEGKLLFTGGRRVADRPRGQLIGLWYKALSIRYKPFVIPRAMVQENRKLAA
jgi:hypothetical protein